MASPIDTPTAAPFDMSKFDIGDVLVRFATKKLPKNKTFNPKGELTVADLANLSQENAKRSSRSGEKSDMISEVFDALRWQSTLAIAGSAGIGKSAMIYWVAEAINEIVPGGIELMYIGPNRPLEQTILPIATWLTNDAGEREIVTKIGKAAELCSGKPVIVILEEFSRLVPPVQAAAMEIISQHCIAGEKIPVLASFMLDNTGKDFSLMTEMSPPLKDRVSTMAVTSASTPWPYFVASTLPDEDLSAYFQAYWGLSESVREVVTGRFMERLIYVSRIKGWDPSLALPRLAGDSVRLRERAAGADGREGRMGTDVTEDVLKKLSSSLGAVTRKPDFSETFDQVVIDGKNLLIEGPPGGGKTSFMKARLDMLGFEADDVLVISGTTLHPDLLSTTIVTEGQLHTSLGEWFQRPAAGPKGKVLVIDDIWMMSPYVKPCVMEITQERSIAGKPIKDLHAIVAITNGAEAFGEKIGNISKPDLAQADRFTVNVVVNYNDIPFDDFLIGQYGETASVVVDWWKTDLTDDHRNLVSPRCLERIIQRAISGMTLERALLHRDIDGKRRPIEVDLHKLRMRLKDLTPTSLKTIIEKVDEYETAMSDPANKYGSQHKEVADVFESAALSELRANKDAVRRLLHVLDGTFKVVLITRDSNERKHFFIKLLTGKTDEA